MTLEERSNLVLAFARALYVNGQSTDQTLATAERLGDIVGLRARILARWGSCNFRPRTGTPDSSALQRPILPAWTWIAWFPPCGP